MRTAAAAAGPPGRSCFSGGSAVTFQPCRCCPPHPVPAPAVQVHHGFLQQYDSIRPQVLGIIDTLLEEPAAEGEQQGNGEERPPWTVYITGHSLGAALATLCTFDLAART